jgi:assimilatory nitrate reductase catalytic subunit
MAESVRTTCPYCGVGCGVLVRRRDDGGIDVAGDPHHPANRGMLCAKGQTLGETVGLEGRLLRPEVEGRPTSWEAALSAVAQGFRQVVERHGPQAVAFYVSGQLLTEDYYVANKLMKGFIGAANIDTNSRLCMASSVAGHVRAFGADTVPGCYEDLELADLVVLVGSNAAWCHPVLFRRLQAARAARPGMKLVIIDPRRTATAEEADLHLAIRPGSDAALFNGLFRHLLDCGAADQGFIAAHTEGLAAACEAAGTDTDSAAVTCELPRAVLATFYDWFAASPRVVTAYSQGVNQSTSGTDKVNAIINCHLLTGRIGKPGVGPLSLTGQPNAMGGREVGGLANQLAAHMGFDETSVERLRRFWNAPRMAHGPGLKAVQLFDAVAEGKIKALWIMATNPAVSMPDADRVRRALAACDFVVVSDCAAATDTARYAHVRLPALTWAEKDGTVTNSERRISRQRAVLPPPGEARPDWWIICQVAKRLGFGQAFDYGGPSDIFREHARLSALDNAGSRDFDIGGLAEADYRRLAPVQWPVRDAKAAEAGGTARLFADGRFFHPDGKARFVAVNPRLPAARVTTEWPLLLNTGRARDQWHTMTRSGQVPRLAAHQPDPWLAVHPLDAARFGLADGALAEVEAPYGSALLRVQLDAGQRLGEVFAPIHWNDQYAARAVVSRLVAGATDAISGQPELKASPIRLRPVPVAWQALLLARRSLALEADSETLWWSRAAGLGHVAYRLAGRRPVGDWPGWARRQLGGGTWLEYRDPGLGLYRAALLVDGRLEAALWVMVRGAGVRLDALPDSLAALFDRPRLATLDHGLLLGGGSCARSDAGPVICACHQIGRQTILDGLRHDELRSVEDIGRALRAGTGCGACIPELRALLRQATNDNPPEERTALGERSHVC